MSFGLSWMAVYVFLLLFRGQGEERVLPIVSEILFSKEFLWNLKSKKSRPAHRTSSWWNISTELDIFSCVCRITSFTWCATFLPRNAVLVHRPCTKRKDVRDSERTICRSDWFRLAVPSLPVVEYDCWYSCCLRSLIFSSAHKATFLLSRT